MEYLRLIKLLYMADRESWDRFGRPITGDNYVSMDHGPVLSQTYNRIKNEGDVPAQGYWERTVERVSRTDVRLKSGVNIDPLTPAEVKLLKETFHRFSAYGTWELVELLHRTLKEWKDPGGSSSIITPEEILKALGKADQIDAVREEAEEQAQLQQILGR